MNANSNNTGCFDIGNSKAFRFEVEGQRITRKFKTEALRIEFKGMIDRQRELGALTLAWFRDYEAPAKPETRLTFRDWAKDCLERSMNSDLHKDNERQIFEFWSEGEEILRFAGFGPKLLPEITYLDITKVLADMKNATKPAAGGKRGRVRIWKNGTINHRLVQIRKLFRLAFKSGLVPSNPADGIAKLPVSKREVYFTHDELAALKAIMAPEDWNLVELAIQTGLRQGNLFGLRWAWIELDKALLTLPAEFMKSKKPLYIPLSAPALAVLRSLDSWQHSSFVFPALRNLPRHKGQERPMDTDAWLLRAWEPALLQLKIVGKVWHDLRHTCASFLLEQGWALDEIKEYLGHADIATTMRYAHRKPGNLQSRIHALGARGVMGLSHSAPINPDTRSTSDN